MKAAGIHGRHPEGCRPFPGRINTYGTMTKQELLDQAVDTELYNTNNAWGFGGSYGKKYFFSNGMMLKIGTACYRHLPSHGIWTLYDNKGNRLIMGNATFGKRAVELVTKALSL